MLIISAVSPQTHYLLTTKCVCKFSVNLIEFIWAKGQVQYYYMSQTKITWHIESANCKKCSKSQVLLRISEFDFYKVQRKLNRI